MLIYSSHKQVSFSVGWRFILVKTSFYIGNNPSDVEVAEKWLGRDVDALQMHVGFQSWSDLVGCQSWLASLFKGSHADLMWSVPLIPLGSTLAASAAGAYDSKYLQLANQFVANSAGDGQIYIRLGWEFNGDGWFPWSAVGKEQDYVKAYQNFVDIFRSVSDKFVFEWTPNVGDVGMNSENAYPGDDYVDVIGMDFYYNTQWDSKNPLTAWNYFVNEAFGLQWHQDFAAAHGKPTAYAEWGVNSDGAGPFIELAAKWFKDHNVLYQNYWESNAAFAGLLEGGQYPNAAAMYKAIFGAQPYTGAVVVDNQAPSAPVVTPHGAPTDDTTPEVHGTAEAGATVRLFEGATALGQALADTNGTWTITTSALSVGLHQLSTVAVDAAGNVSAATASPIFISGTIFSDVSLALGAGLTDLVLTGNGTISGTGNALANRIVGNGAANIFDGGSNADLMQGLGGNDIYIVDNAGDVVDESVPGSNGVDTVQSSLISIDLSDLVHFKGAIENATLTGSSALNLIGNAIANILTGNCGANRINGGGGIDTAVYSGNRSEYNFAFDKATSETVVTDINLANGNDGADRLKNIEFLNFADQKQVDIRLLTAVESASFSDIDGSGKSDLLWRNSSGQMMTWQDMAGIAHESQSFALSTVWLTQAIGDFNGDGRADIMFRNTNGNVAAVTSVAGSRTTVASYGNVDPAWKIISAGDFDGDGSSGLIWRKANGATTIWNSMQPNEIQTEVSLGNPGKAWHVVGVGDFDGDLKADILWRNDNGRSVIWNNIQTDGGHGEIALGKVGTNWHVEGTADFTSDGKVDVLWRSDKGDIVVWSAIQPNGVHATVALGKVSVDAWTIAAVGDYNGDGQSDIVFRNINGFTVIWEDLDGRAHTTEAIGTVGSNWTIQDQNFEIV